LGEFWATPVHSAFKESVALFRERYRQIRESAHDRPDMSSFGPVIPERILRLMSQEDQARYKKETGKMIGQREVEEQRIFNNWLNLRLAERQLYPINPRSDKASTIRCGHPDYTIFLPNARMLLLEMKVAGGRLSEEQLKCIELLSELGYVVEIPYSAAQAIQIVERFF
jgi:VRR-NUC domain-containing protein